MTSGARRKLRATLSLDLDDSWTYMRAAGKGDWEHAESVIPLVCERLLEVTREVDQRLSLFVVGRDLLHEARSEAIRPLVTAGHEIGCHSFDHRPEFATLGIEDLQFEIAHGTELIAEHLGCRPVGFRAPGYARHRDQDKVLAENGFRYDGSSLPTFLGPACRAYYFFKSGMPRAERRRRAAMYGGLRDAFAPNRAHTAAVDQQLLNVPVTTVPVLRTPMHMSYVIWVAKRSRRAAMAYLRSSLATCRLFRVEPSYLLHSLDFVGKGDHSELDFFPGMDVEWERKRGLLVEVIGRLQQSFNLMAMDDFADDVLGGPAAGPQAQTAKVRG